MKITIGFWVSLGFQKPWLGKYAGCTLFYEDLFHIALAAHIDFQEINARA